MSNRASESSSRTWFLVLVAAFIEAPLVWLLTLHDLRLYVVETIAVLLAISLFYIVSVWLLLESERDGYNQPLMMTRYPAMVFRVTD
jgi:hypothetical protein